MKEGSGVWGPLVYGAKKCTVVGTFCLYDLFF